VLNEANSLIVHQKTGLELAVALCSLISEISVLFLMELGHKAHRLVSYFNINFIQLLFRNTFINYFQIADRKDQLKYVRVVCKYIPEVAGNAGTLFLDWDWKFSAGQFFTVDRSLVAAVKN